MARKQPTGGKGKSGGAPPSPRRRRRPLNTAAAIFKEMAAVYRDARDGTIRTGDGTKFVFMLAELRKALEVSDLVVAFEQRISSLEARLAPQKP